MLFKKCYEIESQVTRLCLANDKGKKKGAWLPDLNSDHDVGYLDDIVLHWITRTHSKVKYVKVVEHISLSLSLPCSSTSTSSFTVKCFFFALLFPP